MCYDKCNNTFLVDKMTFTTVKSCEIFTKLLVYLFKSLVRLPPRMKLHG